ncbi:hypothetical protein ACTFIY_003973 [Dictyostelium cf. discoideum]
MKRNPKLGPEELASIREFKAITAQGKKRPMLSQQEHEELVQEKFKDGKSRTGHITAFRIGDKKGLPPQEKSKHTVQGPNWSPPSSVGFVLGGMTQNLRLWLASPLTDDPNGIAQNDNKPAIYAREIISPVLAGYTPRPPKHTERYGQTDRQPKIILTPPSSPKKISSDQIQKIMNVENSWDELPLHKVYLTSLPKLSLIDLKGRGVDLNHFTPDTLKEIDINGYEEGFIDIIFTPQVLLFIKGGNSDLKTIEGIYLKFIQEGYEKVDAPLFLELHNLLEEYDGEFEELFIQHGMSIEEIVDLYKDEPEIFKAATSGVFNDYEIGSDKIKEIYDSNPELFFSIINDPEGILKSVGLGDFCQSFEETQRFIDLNNLDCSAYDMVVDKYAQDGCPEEMLLKGSSEDDNSDTEDNPSGDFFYTKESSPELYYNNWKSSFDFKKINVRLKKLKINKFLDQDLYSSKSFNTISDILTQINESPCERYYHLFSSPNFPHTAETQKSVKTYGEVCQLKNQILELVEYINYSETGVKSQNKTNGVTPRRWIQQSNPQLAELITRSLNSDRWLVNLEIIKDLVHLADNSSFQKEWMEIKRNNKIRLAKYIEKKCDIQVNVDVLFDVQVKRFHEYKRQLLNILSVINRYFDIKEGKKVAPRVVIFGGKAAPGYYMAKLIIKLINSVADVVNNDSKVGDLLKIVFIPNYCVSNAEIIIPASDISHIFQPNMKFSMNGGLIIGTLDSANIEIRDAIGHENMYIFGSHSEEVNKVKKIIHDGKFSPDARWARFLTAIKEDTFGPHEQFQDIINSVSSGNDHYILSYDFGSYLDIQNSIDQDFKDRAKWAKKSIMASVCCGKFSSDRTIKEYAQQIWGIEEWKRPGPVPVSNEEARSLLVPPPSGSPNDINAISIERLSPLTFVKQTSASPLSVISVGDKTNNTLKPKQTTKGFNIGGQPGNPTN